VAERGERNGEREGKVKKPSTDSLVTTTQDSVRSFEDYGVCTVLVNGDY